MLEDDFIYIVNFSNKDFVSRLIRFWTRGRYSHSAVLFPDGKLLEVWPFNQKKWEYVTLLTNHDQDEEITVFEVFLGNHYKDIKQMYDQLVGKAYDWRAIIGFVLKLKKGNRNKYFCSEGSVTPIKKFFEWTYIDPEYVSPERLVELLDVWCLAKLNYKGTILDFIKNNNLEV